MNSEALGGAIQQLRVLNGVIPLDVDAVAWEPDPRHLEVRIGTLDHQHARRLTSPGTVEVEGAPGDAADEDEVRGDQGSGHVVPC